MVVKRILVCGDFLATTEKEQERNRRWLIDLLYQPIKLSTGVEVVSFSSSITDESKLSRKDFFIKSDINVDYSAIQFLFDVKRIQSASLDYLSQYISDNDLIIGYELSEQTRNVLNQLKINYIDIWLHPIRYLDDILFCFNSNNILIHNKLFDFNIDREVYIAYATRLKVQSYRGWKRGESDVPKNSAVFIGQTLNDKSVNRNGRFLSVIDFREQFEQLVRSHDKVFYSRHPFVKYGDEHILQYIRQFKNVSLTDFSSYDLLCHKNVKTIMSVSSSVLIEAKYFGKKTVCLYRPVVALCDTNEHREYHYSSVYQDFVFSYFWSKVLSPVLPVKECSRISFFNEKDKLRDALGFYWSYGKIDKVEEMRDKLNVVARKVANFSKHDSKQRSSNLLSLKSVAINSDAVTFQKHYVKEIKNKILNADIVSFDVFDTLLERSISIPSAIFTLMESQLSSICNNKELLEQFSQYRQNIRNTSKPEYFFNEEFLLFDRYKSLGEKFHLTDEEIENIYHLELNWEERVSIPKEVGYELYQFALSHKKKIIIVSDTYFPENFVVLLLNKAGYNHWDKLYCSSTSGLLKDSGHLFDVVINDFSNMKPSQIFHIGDNKHSDVTMPNSKGMSASYIASKHKVFQGTPLCQALQKIKSPISKSIFEGVISRKYVNSLNDNEHSFSYLQSSPYNFGYNIIGIMFFAFSKWILENAIDDGVKDIYFLSRDGDIVKKCYDIIAKLYPNAPSSHYIYASRRSIRVSSICSVPDILKILETNFTPMAIGDLLMYRFGVNGGVISKSVYAKYGFQNASSIADWKLNSKKLKEFFADNEVSGRIIENAAKERDLLIEYYRTNGLDNHDVAFVDIGHLGTLQQGILSLLSLDKTYGYYFATFVDIDKNIPLPHMTKGFVVDRLDNRTNKEHFYLNHILMYEFSFINDQDSFVSFATDKSNRQKIKPVFLQVDDVNRKKFATITHQAVQDFCTDVVERYGDVIKDISISPEEACALYEHMMRNPTLADIKVFENLNFENVYSGRPVQWVTPDLYKDKKRVFLWKELGGYSLIDSHSGKGENLWYRLVKLYAKYASKSQYSKFQRDPVLFCEDSRFFVIRWLGRRI